MQTESKRKFLLTDVSVLAGHRGFPIVQGDLARGAARVTVRTFGSFAFLKVGIPRPTPDFEYPIPLEDALAMLEKLCSPWPIRKTRYLVPHEQIVIEVDLFEGQLAGLAVAELDADSSAALPAWLGREITGDPTFAEEALAHAKAPPAAEPPT